MRDIYVSDEAKNRLFAEVRRGTHPGIADTAGVSPRNFRHYFVTVCEWDCGMDDATVAQFIGHDAGGSTVGAASRHRTGEAHIEAAEVTAGLQGETDESPPALHAGQ